MIILGRSQREHLDLAVTKGNAYIDELRLNRRGMNAFVMKEILHIFGNAHAV